MQVVLVRDAAGGGVAPLKLTLPPKWAARPLRALLDAYCKKQQLDAAQFALARGGKRFDEKALIGATLKDGDSLLVVARVSADERRRAAAEKEKGAEKERAAAAEQEKQRQRAAAEQEQEKAAKQRAAAEQEKEKASQTEPEPLALAPHPEDFPILGLALSLAAAVDRRALRVAAVGPSGREAPCWLSSTADTEPAPTGLARPPADGRFTVALHPSEAGDHEIRLFLDGAAAGALPWAAPEPPAPAPRPWGELPPGRRDAVEAWLAREARGGRCAASLERTDTVQLPLPAVDDFRGPKPAAWRRPKPGAVAVVEDFVPAALRERLLREAGHLVVSNVRLSSTLYGERAEYVPGYRTNSSCFLDERDAPCVGELRRRAAAYFPEVAPDLIELQLVHYKPREFYKLHHDCPARAPSGHYPRRYSVFCYLAAPEKGGGTAFPRAQTFEGDPAFCEPMAGGGFLVKPPAGCAVVWDNLDPCGDRLDKRAEHSGTAIDAGEKWGINVWLPSEFSMLSSSARLFLKANSQVFEGDPALYQLLESSQGEAKLAAFCFVAM